METPWANTQELLDGEDGGGTGMEESDVQEIKQVRGIGTKEKAGNENKHVRTGRRPRRTNEWGSMQEKNDDPGSMYGRIGNEGDDGRRTEMQTKTS